MTPDTKPRCKGSQGAATCHERQTCALFSRYVSDGPDVRYVKGGAGIKLYTLPRVTGQQCHYREAEVDISKWLGGT